MRRLSDLRSDSWFLITRTIARGEHPKESDLAAALARQEPNVPGEAQVYIARLLSGEIDRRGRPVGNEQYKVWLAELLIHRIERWERVYRTRYKKPNAKMLAYDKVASERDWKNGDVARRNYEKAKALLSRLVGQK